MPARADACATNIAVAPLDPAFDAFVALPHLTGWLRCGARLWAVGAPAGAAPGAPRQLWYTSDLASPGVTALAAESLAVSALPGSLSCWGGRSLLATRAAGPLAVVDVADPFGTPLGALGPSGQVDAGFLQFVPSYGTCWSAQPAAGAPRTALCANTLSAAAPGDIVVQSWAGAVATPATGAHMAGHGGALFLRCRAPGGAESDPYYACALRPGVAPAPAATIYDTTPAATVASFPLVAAASGGSPAAVLFHTAPAPGSGDAGGSLWAVPLPGSSKLAVATPPRRLRRALPVPSARHLAAFASTFPLRPHNWCTHHITDSNPALGAPTTLPNSGRARPFSEPPTKRLIRAHDLMQASVVAPTTCPEFGSRALPTSCCTMPPVCHMTFIQAILTSYLIATPVRLVF